ncbi:hypothetical protein [Achromobacter insolitus]|uniref:hypothetical protein n=1 Tax=Achromobacter insolitus TaxID=217204 RepID=UPI0013F4D47A|nr:hypothetical protein [Achromobacter insolitus]
MAAALTEFNFPVREIPGKTGDGRMARKEASSALGWIQEYGKGFFQVHCRC